MRATNFFAFAIVLLTAAAWGADRSERPIGPVERLSPERPTGVVASPELGLPSDGIDAGAPLAEAARSATESASPAKIKPGCPIAAALTVGAHRIAGDSASGRVPDRAVAALFDASAPSAEGADPPAVAGWRPSLLKRLIREGPLAYLSAASRSPEAREEGIFRISFPPLPSLYVVMDAALVRQILRQESENFTRSSSGISILKGLFGDSILSADGKEHHDIRRELQGPFKPRPVREHADEVFSLAERRVSGWRRDRAFDIAAEMREIALMAFAKVFFGVDEDLITGSRLMNAMRDLSAVLTRSIVSLPLPSWLPTRLHRDQWRVRKEIDEALYELIDERVARANPVPNLLDGLIAASPMTPGRREYLRDQLTALFFAGHETSANLLAWTFHLIAEHPLVEEKLRAEMSWNIGERAPSAGDLDRLPYLRAVIMESMRLHPPGWLLDRAPVKDLALGGYRVPKGTFVLLPLFLLNRGGHFQAPSEFRPERFESAADWKTLHDDVFMPFGGGPHYCLGSFFAMDTARAVVLSVLRHWHLEGDGGPAPIPLLGASMGIKGGLRLIVRPAP